MPNSSERFYMLSHQLESLVNRLNQCPELEERKQLLRQMKVVIVEIDMLILSSLKQDNLDTASSLLPGLHTADA